MRALAVAVLAADACGVGSAAGGAVLGRVAGGAGNTSALGEALVEIQQTAQRDFIRRVGTVLGPLERQQAQGDLHADCLGGVRGEGQRASQGHGGGKTNHQPFLRYP